MVAPYRRKTKPEVPVDDDLASSLSELAQKSSKHIVKHKPRSTSRKDLEDAFHSAFQLVGGVPRLVYWADDHYDDFIRLYSKLLPQQLQAETNHSFTIKTILGQSPLDQTALDDRGRVIDVLPDRSSVDVIVPTVVDSEIVSESKTTVDGYDRTDT